MKALMCLKNSMRLKGMGCSFDRGLTGGVSVSIARRGVGAWRYEDEVYRFTAVSYGTPQLEAASLDELITETAELATSWFIRNRKIEV